jgi:hypothetical protein
LVLSYIQTLVWPALAIVALIVFRSQIGTLLQNARRIKAFGAEAEFGQLETQIKRTDLEVGAIEISPASSSIAVVDDTSAEIAQVTNYDIADLDPDDPVSSVLLAADRLERVLLRVLDYLGFPAVVTYLPGAGAALATSTQVPQWSEIYQLGSEMKQQAREVQELNDAATKARDKPAMEMVDRNARQLITQMYRIASTVPGYLKISLMSADMRSKLYSAEEETADTGSGQASSMAGAPRDVDPAGHPQVDDDSSGL